MRKKKGQGVRAVLRSLILIQAVLCVPAANECAAAASSLLLRGGLVYTITGPTLKNADVLIRDGKIAAVGTNLAPPRGAKVIDLRGKVVMPGLVLAQDVWRLGTPPDRVDVFSVNMLLALSAGVTTVSAGRYVMNLTYGDPSGLILAREGFFGVAPDTWRSRYELRRNLLKAREYLRDLSAYERAKEEGKAAQPPVLPNRLRGYVSLLRGEVKALANVDQAQDILRACALAREFDFSLVINGAVEAWSVAREISAAQASVILSIRRLTAHRPDPDSPPGSNVRAAAILHSAGVPLALVPPVADVSITGGIAGRDVMSLLMEAAFAVRGGLEENAALAAVTIEPARILGVAHRVGSVEVGKDANLIVLDGDPLYWKSFVELAIINGKIYYDRSKSDLFVK